MKKGIIMQIELTYQMPYRRLAKLSRSMGFKFFRALYLVAGLILVALAAWLAGVIIYADALVRWMPSVGISPDVGGILVIGSGVALWVAGIILCTRLRRKILKSRVDYDQTIRLTKDDGGLRIAGNSIEYYLKWQGINEMLMERDGVVVSCGALFFLVPDAAFTDAGQRLAFIRDVYDRLGDKARSASDKYIRPVLDGGALRSGHT
jgi:hypothetical protein